MRVLIVEDLPEVRQLLRRQIEALGFVVDEATNRTDGLAMLFGDPEIGIVLLDLGLPPNAHDFEEGIQFLKTVADHNSLAKVIVLTGQSAPTVTLKAIEYGAFDYLEKPIDRQALHYAIKRAELFHKTHDNMREADKVNISIVADASAEINMKDIRGQATNKLLRTMFEKNHFNVSATARQLNMSREHLYYYLKKYNIKRPAEQRV